MKLSVLPSNVQTNISGQKYKIEANNFAFDILSNKLYTDHIAAVIRELSTNAYDSHVAANKANVPFDVHLPTHDEPYFTIRDYGVGMSLEQMERLYTTYFASDKRNSDDFNGQLGLGSKSPFAYCETFTVISYFHGKAYHYVCNKTDEGPSSYLLNETDTNEPNGVFIQVPVQTCDIYEFTSTANKIYKFFSIKPNCNKQLDHIVHSFVINDKIYLDHSIKNSEIYVVMGNVCYPTGKYSNYIYPNKSGVIVNIDIGDVEITPSREHLANREKTNQFLTKLVKEVEDAIKNYLDNEINKQPTWLEKEIKKEELGKYFTNKNNQFSAEIPFDYREIRRKKYDYYSKSVNNIKKYGLYINDKNYTEQQLKNLKRGLNLPCFLVIEQNEVQKLPTDLDKIYIKKVSDLILPKKTRNTSIFKYKIDKHDTEKYDGTYGPQPTDTIAVVKEDFDYAVSLLTWKPTVKIMLVTPTVFAKLTMHYKWQTLDEYVNLNKDSIRKHLEPEMIYNQIPYSHWNILEFFNKYKNHFIGTKLFKSLQPLLKLDVVIDALAKNRYNTKQSWLLQLYYKQFGEERKSVKIPEIHPIIEMMPQIYPQVISKDIQLIVKIVSLIEKETS